MILINTKLWVADNSGILKIKCINIYKKKKNPGYPGDIILFSLRKINLQKNKISKGTLMKGVIVRLKDKIRRSGGYIFMNQNAVIILNKNNLPLGNRIFGPIFRELRNYKKYYNKLLSISTYII